MIVYFKSISSRMLKGAERRLLRRPGLKPVLLFAGHYRAARVLAPGLSYLLAFQLTAAWAQVAQTPPSALNILVVDGEGAITNTGQRAAHDPVVRVEDDAHKPVAGAAVVFTLPTEGATGEFMNHSKTLTVITDDKGEAAARGLRANGVPGKLPIHISASYRGVAARTNMTQFSVAPAGSHPEAGHGRGGHGKLAAVLLIVGGAAGGGAAYALSRNSARGGPGAASPGSTAIGLTAGAGAISLPPH
jgi:hypothetical protein